MDFWNVLIYGGIPILTVALLFVMKRKCLWAAPLLSAVAAFITYMVAACVTINPSAMMKMLCVSEYRGFLFLALAMQFGITILLTLIAAFVTYLLARKRKSTK